jgi:hypothetical protein
MSLRLVPPPVAVALAAAALLAACGAPATPEEAAQEILAREPPAASAEVLHVLVGWADLASAYGARMDERAKARTKAEADTLAMDVLKRARAGEDFPSLMKAHSEDWASAQTGKTYTVTPDARLVPPFRALSLRLQPGETGIVETKYGWHVIQRIQ